MTLAFPVPTAGPASLRLAVEEIAKEARRDLGTALATVSRSLEAIPPDRHDAVADLLHTAVDLGLLSAFLDAATTHATTRTRPWPGTGYERAADDPHLTARFGKFVASIRALDALMDEATLEAERGSAGAGRAAATARHHAMSVGRAFVSSTIELLGASAASVKHGFDMRWRDVVEHARHHPPRTPLEALGRA